MQISNPQRITRITYLFFFVFSFFGPSLGVVKIGSVSIFPARFFSLLTWTFVILTLICGGRLIFSDKLGWQHIFLAVWLVWALVSLSWVVNQGQGLRDLANLFIGLSLVGLAPVFIKERRQLIRAAHIWLAVFLFFIGLGIIEHITAWHLPISRFSQGHQPYLVSRPTAVFVNENNFAVFITLSLPFALARWRYFPSILSRVALGLGLFSAIYLLYVTGSRINWIVLIIMVLIYSLFLTLRGKKLQTLGILSILLISVWIVFSLISPTLSSYSYQEAKEIGKSYQDILESSSRNSSISIRMNLIRNGVRCIIQTRGIGIGTGNFETWIENNALYDTRGVFNPHNWWIELASEYGAVIVIGYLAFYLSLLWAAWQEWHKTQGRDKWVPEAICLALASFPVAAFSPSSMLGYSPHWLLLAVSFAWQQYAQKAGVHNAHSDGLTPLSFQD